MIAQQCGDATSALHTTHRLVHDGTRPSELHHLDVQLLIAAGYLADAGRHAAAHAGACTEPVRRLITATVLLHQSNARPAIAQLEPFQQHTDVSTLHRIDALLLRAAAAHLDDIEHAADLRRQAHRMAAPARIRRPFLLEQRNTRRTTWRAQGSAVSAPPTPGANLNPSTPVGHLTDAELAVLHLPDTLLTNDEIAERLHLTTNTVKTHLSSVYRKLGVHRRRDAINRAHHLGLS